MKPIKAIYVDDEAPALELIKKYCLDMPEIELMDTFLDPTEALNYLLLESVELLILDIEMPGLSGTDFLALVPKGKLCIFITADPTYAARAFDMDVIDYLVKPVFPDRFKKAVQKAIDYLKFSTSEVEQSYLTFKSDYKLNRVLLDDIQWIEGFREYIKIVTRFKQYLVLQRLSDFMNKNGELGFVRIHKSYIVRKKDIVSISAQSVQVKGGKQLPIGRTYKDLLK
ncbi:MULTISPECIES: LytR/AlgR family response regulator transcription factor [unclassified Pedobacter]|uniref:LytR/AlgR family response regulator transcription factor n=1 Tax=unclassified Pedobacter TaxID=2628915 RepID=UPI00141E1A63|nr:MULTISPECIES: LytTR family DNA-binding domain-containing protein [unclassified Pedobacter]NII81028.1 DNA-binding LytR/AlgR family response regulator [Pedobacter sp. SG908]NMN35043.1 DNA-binding LytR/AlgR family response regulator [Pedobacter sp. SG918]